MLLWPNTYMQGTFLEDKISVQHDLDILLFQTILVSFSVD